MAQRPPSLPERADALVAAGRTAEAYKMLAAAKTDRDALFTLAVWRLSGQIVRRDLAAARELFRRAAGAGHVLAAEVHTAFVANGAGGPSDWQAALRLLETHGLPGAADELALIGQMRLSPTGDPLDLPTARDLADRPRVTCIPGLFSPDECAFLMRRALPQLAPSVVVDPQTGRQMRNPIRSSDSMSFGFVHESPAVHALNRRLAAATGTATGQGEPLQVLRYRPGEEYRAHSDALTGEANQRILTALVYLNEDYEGGETLFVKTGLRFRGRQGDALIFRNALPDGRPDELALHAGLPVSRGAKFIASRWIRERPFSMAPPRPMLDV